ncbi:MAG TPA: GNAT family N-acetyltransferase [Flavobacterium sp.]|nr:GNAT family N-acetyltransferase [Flavobacterium sp.]
MNTTIGIRKALPTDYKAIAQCLMLAMEDIFYVFIGEHSNEKAVDFLEQLVQKKDNQYSYENCWLAVSENEVVGAGLVYDGAKLHQLRAPVAQEIKKVFGKDFNPEDETQAGEFYIDCVGVYPNQQGRGIGSAIFKFLIQEYVLQRKLTLGLLVEKNNPGAKNLYLKLGFEVMGDKILVGTHLEHLQFRLK